MSVDWTKQPIGAARAILLAQVSNLYRLLNDQNAAAHVVDEKIVHLERAIKAFRDNER